MYIINPLIRSIPEKLYLGTVYPHFFISFNEGTELFLFIDFFPAVSGLGGGGL